mgnify:CR=1 FL=1
MLDETSFVEDGKGNAIKVGDGLFWKPSGFKKELSKTIKFERNISADES